ncbi:MAG: peptidase M50 [Pseudomonadota bacterium]
MMETGEPTAPEAPVAPKTAPKSALGGGRTGRHWHRISGLRLALSPGVTVTRQVNRGVVWYVLYNAAANRSHRLNRAAYAIVARLDGRATVAEAREAARVDLGDDLPSEDAVVELVGMLSQADCLMGDAGAVPDAGEAASRGARMERMRRRAHWMNPLFLRVPLADPDRFLTATLPLVRPLFSWPGFLVWLALMAWLVAEAALNWDALGASVADRVLAADNLLLLVIVFPLLKALHELGHGYAVKLGGGEVREIGIMFLVLLPVPYVEASATAAFPSKWSRVLVGAAGMMAELAVAAGAMLVWLEAEPGLVRALAFNTLFIAGVSTLVFNGNPLLRFDAYYILSDIAELPNLAQRSNRLYARWVQSVVFGIKGLRPVISAPGERPWFVAYAPAAFVYRLVVVFGIALFVATEYFFLGIALAAWSVTLSLLWPLAKALWFVVSAPSLATRRWRAVLATAATGAAIAGLVFAVPLPRGTVATGLVEPPQGSEVLAAADGVVARIVENGTAVAPGDPVAWMRDVTLTARLRLDEARLEELELRLRAVLGLDAGAVEQLKRQVAVAREDLAATRAEVEDLVVRASHAGVVALPLGDRLVGRHLRRGDRLGHVVDARPPVARVLVAAEDWALVSGTTTGIDILQKADPWRALPGRAVTREEPSATRRLPDPAFAETVDGPFALDPAADAEQGLRSLLPFFVVEIALPEGLDVRWRERVMVRFAHPPATVGERGWRALRQLFLERFDV